MAYGDVFTFYAAAYTDVIAAVHAQLVASGWTQVGTSDIYKSAVTDADGNFAYVEITDDGFMRNRSGVAVNAAEDALIDNATTTSNFIAAHWAVMVFPLWYITYKLDDTQSDDYLLGGGLYRPFARTPFRTHPYFSSGSGSAGGNTVTLTGGSGFQEGHQTRMMNYDHRYATPGVPMVGVGTGGLTNLYRQSAMSGGLVITPNWIHNPVDILGFFGTWYNSLAIYSMNMDRSSKSLLTQPGCILPVNGVRYYVPPRYEIPGGDQCQAIFFQLDNF